MNEKQRKSVDSRTESDKKKLLEALRKMPIIHVACKRAGVSKATYYRWRTEDAEFAIQADEAFADGKGLINDMAESQLVSAINDKNIHAIKYWLGKHHDAYREKVEINGTLHVSQELSPEQRALIEQALELAGLKPHDGEPERSG